MTDRQTPTQNFVLSLKITNFSLILYGPMALNYGRYGLDGAGSELGQVAGSFECGNEISGSIKCGEFFD